MFKKMMMVAIVAALTTFITAPGISKQKSEKEITKSKMTQMEEKGPLKQITCSDAACGFTVQGRNEHEIVEIMKNHAKKYHNLTLSEKELKAKVSELASK